MIRLVGWELKKLLAGRHVLPVLLLFIGFAFFQDFMLYGSIKEHVDASRVYYGLYGGVLTEEKYDAIRGFAAISEITDERGWLRQDYLFGTTAMGQVEYMLILGKTNETILKRARENATFFAGRGYAGLARLNGQILSLYRDLPQPWVVPSSVWRDFFTGHFGCRFLAFPLVMIVLLVSGIFPKERESGLHPIIKASQTGLRATFWAKYAAAAVCSVGVMLVFFIVNIAVKSFTNCLYGWGAPIRSVAGFEYSWLNLSILQTVVLFGSCMCLGAMLFGLLTAAVSSFMHSGFLSMAAAFACSILAYLWAYAFQYYSFIYTYALDISQESGFMVDLIDRARVFVATFLLEPFYYFETYRHVMVFSIPVPVIAANVCVGIVFTSCLIAVSYKVYAASSAKKGGLGYAVA